MLLKTLKSEAAIAGLLIECNSNSLAGYEDAKTGYKKQIYNMLYTIILASLRLKHSNRSLNFLWYFPSQC